MHLQGDDYTWTYAAAAGKPDTWAATALGAVPQIDSLAPIWATAGGPAFPLVVSGRNFVDGAGARWNSTALSTTLGSSTLVTATVGAAHIAQAGNVIITVRNPGGDPLDSNPLTFVVHNPTLAITGLTPGSIPAESKGFVLTVDAKNFVKDAVVLWDGDAYEAQFVNRGKLQVNIPAKLLAQGKIAMITVLNPEPDAQASAAAGFVVQALTAIGTKTYLPLISK